MFIFNYKDKSRVRGMDNYIHCYTVVLHYSSILVYTKQFKPNT